MYNVQPWLSPKRFLNVSVHPSPGLRAPLWNAAALTNLLLQELPPVALLLFPSLLCGVSQGAGAPSDLHKLLTSGPYCLCAFSREGPELVGQLSGSQTVQNALTCYS